MFFKTAFQIHVSDYGESWLDERSGTFADFVPRKDDYLEASKKFHSIKREIEKNGVLLTDSLLRTLKDIISLTRPRVSAVLPDTVEKYDDIMRRRSNREHPAQILAEIGLHRRTVEWIEDNGICLDSILPGIDGTAVRSPSQSGRIQKRVT